MFKHRIIIFAIIAVCTSLFTAQSALAGNGDQHKSDKPVVTVYLSSLGKYDRMIVKNVLLPVWENLNHKFDILIKPGVYVNCGLAEMEENTRWYCLQKEQGDKFIPYLKCLLSDNNSAKCLTAIGIDTGKLDKCAASADAEFSITPNFKDKSKWLDGKFPPYSVYAKKDPTGKIVEENERTFSLYVNSQAYDDDFGFMPRNQEWLKQTICNRFVKTPDECSRSLSSTDIFDSKYIDRWNSTACVSQSPAQTNGPSTTANNSSTTSPYFNRNLWFGMRKSAEVSKAQQFLQNQGLYDGPISGNYYLQTMSAVRKFQIKEKIKPATGLWGAKTREVANRMIGTNQ
ncbi:MAG: peptidoglycan-binding domain-containing protein [Candidatus Magasanikbacteria bacterium]